MGIPYDPNKPAANDKPSNDQAPMQQNFASIKTLIDVDHIDFSSNQYGEHQKVTFGSNNPPGGTVTPPILFTNTSDGAGNALPNALAQLFFYSGTAAQGQNNYVSTQNGSVLLPGGIIMKWGSSGLTNASQNFPVAFPNNAFVLIATGYATPYTGGFVTSALSSTAFTVTRTNGVGNTGYYYIAIGN